MLPMLLLALAGVCGATRPFPADATSQAPRITVTYQEADIKDVVASFATFSSRKIVVANGIGGTLSFTTSDQPWDLAFQSILASRQLTACEDTDGTIIVGGCVTNPLAGMTTTLAPVTLSYDNADLRQVALAFSQYTGRTIVVAPGVSEYVTTDIHSQPWNVALQSILDSVHLTASQDEHGVITINPCHSPAST